MITSKGFGKVQSTEIGGATLDRGVKRQEPRSFKERFWTECVEGSAIDPELYDANISLVEDLGGWETYQALGLTVPRFWRNKPHDFGVLACFKNEKGEIWIGKPEKPRIAKNGSFAKYLATKESGNRIYKPSLPPSIRQKISDRYGIEVPLTGSFWDWLERHPEIPVMLAEGAKKGLCLLSMGYVPLTLYGATCGNSPDLDPYLKDDREIIVTFDKDSKPSAIATVNAGINILIKRVGAERLKIVDWNPETAKGCDDLTVAIGPEAVARLINEAVSIEEYRLIQRLNRRLTLPANLGGKIQDLSKLDIRRIPQAGIIAIASGKGTGKTKLVAAMTRDSEKAVSEGHRIALQRNLSERLGLTYQGDSGQTAAARGTRIGGVVDSILGIEPHEVEGGDLILDETTQLIRHLLTSSTCNKDGKRPALLARFRELVRVAKRVILADADLDNATIAYIKELRGNEEIFLIRNDFKLPGYEAKFIHCKNSSAVLGELFEAASQLKDQWQLGEAKKALFVAADSKKDCQAIAKQIETITGLPVLEINSLTSGAEEQRLFVNKPDVVLALQKYIAIVASPSLGTGVSIEAKNAIHSVWGIFSGYSINDGDMSQALMRVRENVSRIVWVAERGKAFSKVSRSANSQELIDALKAGTAASLRILRSSLREDVAGDIEALNFDLDPHIRHWAKIAADQNHSMFSLRAALRTRLKHEGNQITVVDLDSDSEIKDLFKSVRHDIQIIEATAISNAQELTLTEKLALEVKEGATPEERASIQKFNLKEFYCQEEITIDDVLADRNGRRRAEIASLEAQLNGAVSLDRTVRAIERNWHGYICPWDLSKIELQRAVRESLGVLDFIEKESWTKYDLAPYAEKIRKHSADIKIALNVTISEKMTDTQLVHQLLSQLGIKCVANWSRSIEGHEGEKLRVYSIDRAQFDQTMAIIERRKQSRIDREEQAEAREAKPVSQDLEISETDLEDWVQLCEGVVSEPTAIEGWIATLRQNFADKPQARQALWARLSNEARSAFQKKQAA